MTDIMAKAELIQSGLQAPLIVAEKSDSKPILQHRIFGLSFCCTSDLAIIVLNLIYFALNIAVLAITIWAYTLTRGCDKPVVFGSELTPDQCSTFNLGFPFILAIYGLTIIVNIAVVLAAKTYDAFLMSVGLLFYLGQMSLNIWFSLKTEANVLLIVSVVWFLVLLYPHAVFIHEVSNANDKVRRDSSWFRTLN